jgi:hypothetical protein
LQLSITALELLGVLDQSTLQFPSNLVPEMRGQETGNTCTIRAWTVQGMKHKSAPPLLWLVFYKSGKELMHWLETAIPVPHPVMHAVFHLVNAVVCP